MNSFNVFDIKGFTVVKPRMQFCRTFLGLFETYQTKGAFNDEKCNKNSTVNYKVV